MGLFADELRHRIRSFALSTAPADGPDHLTPAAVLIGVVCENGEPAVILTKRSMTVAVHRGQIAFPGGTVEKGDRSFADTALREAFEEIGLPGDRVEVLGYLPALETATGFRIVPVVGLVVGAPSLRPSPDEVDEVFTVSLRELARPDVRTTRLRTADGIAFEDQHFETGGRIVWGATGRLLDEFLSGWQQSTGH